MQTTVIIKIFCKTQTQTQPRSEQQRQEANPGPMEEPHHGKYGSQTNREAEWPADGDATVLVSN